MNGKRSSATCSKRSIKRRCNKLNGAPSPLDRYLDVVKKFTLIARLVTGVGLIFLYFIGISIFASFSSAFGVSPFEFTLQKCLESGSLFTGEFLPVMPRLLQLGLMNYFREMSVLLNFLLGLPLFFILLVKFIGSRTSTWVRKLLFWSTLDPWSLNRASHDRYCRTGTSSIGVRRQRQAALAFSRQVVYGVKIKPQSTACHISACDIFCPGQRLLSQEGVRPL